MGVSGQGASLVQDQGDRQSRVVRLVGGYQKEALELGCIVELKGAR